MQVLKGCCEALGLDMMDLIEWYILLIDVLLPIATTQWPSGFILILEQLYSAATVLPFKYEWYFSMGNLQILVTHHWPVKAYSTSKAKHDVSNHHSSWLNLPQCWLKWIHTLQVHVIIHPSAILHIHAGSQGSWGQSQLTQGWVCITSIRANMILFCISFWNEPLHAMGFFEYIEANWWEHFYVTNILNAGLEVSTFNELN